MANDSRQTISQIQRLLDLYHAGSACPSAIEESRGLEKSGGPDETVQLLFDHESTPKKL
jgi:hypothetical protein